MSTYAGTLSATDGSRIAVALEYTPPSTSTPTIDPALADVKNITIGLMPHRVDGVQRGSNPAFPGGRGYDDLVLFAYPLTVTPTNQFGVEVTVAVDGTVLLVNDRQASGSIAGTQVPRTGYVLSGHGVSRDWLLTNAKQGARVTLGLPTPPPVDPPTPPAIAGPVVAEWVMEWPGYGPHVAALPATTTTIVLAFLQGPGKPVGWGNETQAQLVADLTARRAAGDLVLAGIGGSGGAVTTSNHQGFADAVLAYRASLGGQLDGLCWDIEASGLNGADVLAIDAILAAAVPNWVCALAPNGGNVDQYLPVAVQLQGRGRLGWYGQQFYDANVSLAAAENRIMEAVNAGIPIEKITVGMMIAPDSNHWTLQQCIDNTAAILAKWPTVGGVYLWEAGRDLSDQWSAAMGVLFGVKR